MAQKKLVDLDLEGMTTQQAVGWLIESFKKYNLDDNDDKIIYSVLKHLDSKTRDLTIKDIRQSKTIEFALERLTKKDVVTLTRKLIEE